MVARWVAHSASVLSSHEAPPSQPGTAGGPYGQPAQQMQSTTTTAQMQQQGMQGSSAEPASSSCSQTTIVGLPNTSSVRAPSRQGGLQNALMSSEFTLQDERRRLGCPNEQSHLERRLVSAALTGRRHVLAATLDTPTRLFAHVSALASPWLFPAVAVPRLPSPRSRLRAPHTAPALTNASIKAADSAKVRTGASRGGQATRQRLRLREGAPRRAHRSAADALL